MGEIVEANRRLRLIQIAIGTLRQDMPINEFEEVSGLIEALCRHDDLAIEECLRSPRHDLLVRNDSYRRWVEFELPDFEPN